MSLSLKLDPEPCTANNRSSVARCVPLLEGRDNTDICIIITQGIGVPDEKAASLGAEVTLHNVVKANKITRKGFMIFLSIS